MYLFLEHLEIHFFNIQIEVDYDYMSSENDKNVTLN